MPGPINHIHFWQLQDAKARLSELVKTAVNDGPQGISIRGSETVIVISKEEYDNLTKPRQSFWQFMRNSPIAGCDLDFDRDKSTDRDIQF